MKKVMVTGSFELLHPGHLSLFNQAKALGDYLVVVIARDSTIRQARGREPYLGEGDRLELVSSLKTVDFARLGNAGNRHDVLKEEKPDVVLLGYDQEVNEAMLKKDCEEIGAKLLRAKPFKEKEFKSSIIAKKIGV